MRFDFVLGLPPGGALDFGVRRRHLNRPYENARCQIDAGNAMSARVVHGARLKQADGEVRIEPMIDLAGCQENDVARRATAWRAQPDQVGRPRDPWSSAIPDKRSDSRRGIYEAFNKLPTR